MMGSVFLEGSFWLSAVERAVKTFAQAFVALIGTQAVGILDVDWVQILSVSALAAVVSVLTSVASAEVGKSRGPSLAGETLVPVQNVNPNSDLPPEEEGTWEIPGSVTSDKDD